MSAFIAPASGLAASLSVNPGLPGIDTNAAGVLQIGPSNETSISFRQGTALLDAAGNLVLGFARTFYTQPGGGLDVQAAGALVIGAGLATSVVLGRAGQSVGFYGHAAVAQPVAPVTLADVIAIIRGCGLSA